MLYVTLKIKEYGCGRESANIDQIYAGNSEEAALEAIDVDFDEEITHMNGDSCQDGEDSYMIDEDTDEQISYKILRIEL